MIIGVIVTCNKLWNEASEGSSNLVTASREPLSNECKNSCLYAGKLRWKFDNVRFSEKSAGFLRLIVPVNSEKVNRVNIPKTCFSKLVLNFLRN